MAGFEDLDNAKRLCRYWPDSCADRRNQFRRRKGEGRGDRGIASKCCKWWFLDLGRERPVGKARAVGTGMDKNEIEAMATSGIFSAAKRQNANSG
jgi:hypothetical protein